MPHIAVVAPLDDIEIEFEDLLNDMPAVYKVSERAPVFPLDDIEIEFEDLLNDMFGSDVVE